MLRHFLLIALLLPAAAQAQNLAGDWNGVLDAGVKLHLVLHVVPSGGGFTATLDSVDQNAIGIPVKSVTLTGRKLVLDIAAVHGTYDGTVSDDGNRIEGTWTQAAALPLTFTRAAAKVEMKTAPPSDLDGTWSGALNAGGMKLHLVFHITNTPNGLKASIDSVDQGSSIPVAAVERSGGSIRFDVPAVNGNYTATIAKDEMNGTWTQNGHSLPLVLRRGTNAAELAPKRPQNPKPPFPYDVRNVTFNGLAGTLTTPRGDGPFPAVVLIAGSGPHDRDETILGHKPFLVLADALTRRGIAVLRYDKRGIGKSAGNFATATTADFATDASAAADFLKTAPKIDAHRISLIGHSEGGLIAPIVASQRNDLSSIVLLAGSGVPGDRILIEQARLIAEANGASAAQLKKLVDQQTAILDLVKNSRGDDPAFAEHARAALKGQMSDEAIAAAIPQISSAWMRSFIALDPAVALRKVKCPVLALAGSKDLQVPPDENLAAIRKALQEGGNTHVVTREFPGLNHLFQHAQTGSPAEYGSIQETLAPEVIDAIAQWIDAPRGLH